METVQVKIESPAVGVFYVVASEKALKGLFWRMSQKHSLVSMEKTGAAQAMIQKTLAQLDEYFAGRRQVFDVPLEIEGTEFQKRVWDQLARIPFGKTLSYKDIAVKLGDPNACRAVGTANGRNPISIIVPCHRVITSAGTLGGYAGGLNVKTRLLELENIRLK